MSIIQNLIGPEKYDIKCPYPMEPVGHCIHNTANDASAENEISYMQKNNNEVSFHVAVDDEKSIQGLPFNRNAWAAGDGGQGQGNRKYIHWEICYSLNGGNKFLEAEKRCAKEIAADLKSRGWGIDRVKKHQDFSGKYCPHRTLDMGYQRIIDMIKAELGNLNGSPAPAPTPSNPAPTGAFFRVVSGSYSERANAENAQAKLKAAGYDSFLEAIKAKDGKTYLRVIVGSFKERTSADNRMKELISKDFNAFVAVYNSNSEPVSTTPAPTPIPAPTPKPNPSIGVGNKVNIIATHYSTGQVIPNEQKGIKVHTVKQITGNKALLAEIFSWVNLDGLVLAGTSISVPVNDELKRYSENGKCTITTPSGIRFRDKPSAVTGTVVGTYFRNESVNYDLVVVTVDYVWVSWISASAGVRRYMPITDKKSNERWANCV